MAVPTRGKAAIEGRHRRVLIQEALARNGVAQTRNAVGAVHFTLELVVVGEFVACHIKSVSANTSRPSPKLTLVDLLHSIDDDPLGAFHFDNLCRAIGHAGMIDESSYAPLFGSVDDRVLVDSEQVATADALLVVDFFS